MKVTRRDFVKGSAAAFAFATAGMGSAALVGCAPAEEATEEAPAEEPVEETEEVVAEEATEEAPAEEEVDNTVTFDKVDVEDATADEVQSAIDGNGAVLVDARPQECYAGWALEGAANGGRLPGAKLFSARWIDCDYAGEEPRSVYLDRAVTKQGLDTAESVIVYDYTGEQAETVAQYLLSAGVKSVKKFQANELIDAGGLETYEHYDRFIPTEIVKSVSDVKTGKADSLTDEAKAVLGDDIDRIVLVDVGWGNAKGSSYYLAGHVPGAVHINTDCYERPRVYVPEKRSDYAKEWRLIPLEEFRDELMPAYGIDKDSIVIGTGVSLSPQGRIGFMLRSLGVQYYAMTGLLTAWKYNGYEIDTDESTLVIPTPKESFGSDEIPNPGEILWMDDVKAILAGEREGVVCDNRGEEEWNGEYSGYDYHDLAGHIDGSIWCSEAGSECGGVEFTANADGTPRTQPEIRAYLEDHGADPDKTMAFFCGDSWGAANISYWCQSVDLMNVMQWGNGWIPWSNEGNEFIDNEGRKVHYDKWLDTVVDEDGNDVRNGMNILDDAQPE